MKIVKIERIEPKPLYDIEVEDCKHYILENGIITHNSGLLYSSSIILVFGKSKDKEGEKQVGVNLRCKLKKSRFTKENSVVSVNVDFNSGLDRYYGLVPLAVEAGIFKEISTKIELPDGRKVFEKRINDKPEDFFTKEILDQIDVYVGKKFKYGQSDSVPSEDDNNETAPVEKDGDEE